MNTKRKNAIFAHHRQLEQHRSDRRVAGLQAGYPRQVPAAQEKHDQKRAAVIMCAYSARKNNANFIALYSVWYPPTSSCSASLRSNGVRRLRKKRDEQNARGQRVSHDVPHVARAHLRQQDSSSGVVR